MTPHEAIRALAADERLPYLGLYPAIVKKSQPNEVQVEPMGDWGEVVPPVGIWIPLAIGVPGVTAIAKAGSTVLVGFWGGIPEQPYAIITNPASVVELGVKTTEQGNLSITVDGSASVHARGNATVTADGDVSISATGSVSITGSSVSLG